MKWNNIVTLNMVSIFNRGLPEAVPINMYLGFEGNIFRKILTPQNEAKIGAQSKYMKSNNIAFLSIVLIFKRGFPTIVSI
jgi:hypothetical protein